MISMTFTSGYGGYYENNELKTKCTYLQLELFDP